MSTRIAFWWLFGLALLVVPFPMLVLGAELAPVLRYLQISAWVSAVVLQEGASVTVQQILGVFWLHAIVGTLACWILAWLGARLLRGAPARTRAVVLVVITVAALAVALSGPVYRTPLGREPRANLRGALS